MNRLSVGILVSLMLVGVAAASPPPELEPYSFLLGEWSASGTGQPGSGTGTAAFARSLQDRVIIRTSFAAYPAAGGKPASRHDDLMIMYAHAGGVRADYYDSEGHVIRYAVNCPGPGQAVFISDQVAGEPRYRLSYRLEGGDLKGEFAIAPAGSPEAFKPYLTWSSSRHK